MYPLPESVHWGIAKMITSEEGTWGRRRVSGVAGPDRLSWSQVKGVVSECLASLFNTPIAVARVSPALKEGLTTLIPKIQGSNDTANFRPITVTSCLTRLHHKYWLEDLSNLFPSWRCKEALGQVIVWVPMLFFYKQSLGNELVQLNYASSVFVMKILKRRLTLWVIIPSYLFNWYSCSECHNLTDHIER